ncbi:RTA1 like protein-domain-containing protein [Kockovaella imperatae]|uniref:RTA1 like protein-domain-containing protein n=1 Tax=Kockovaella imperatae TaxID=4999 RepID=A0A1Y1UJI8_9TREE|nr:RTA1 like protein-domain-containing protein [Kockovaella imperatae]ORX38218.1 RTA1 like protein-domain-containing protein [Kockovaella imperatae]
MLSGGYVPSNTLSIIALVLFGLLALIYWLRFFRQGRHRYMLVLGISTTTMAIGFATRIVFAGNPTSLGIYIITILLTLLSPCGFIALNYVLLPRIASHVGAQDALFIRPRWIARIYVTSDITTFWLQACGGGLTAIQNPNIANLGHWISLAALSAQAASFASFTFLAIVFAVRVSPKYIEMVQRHSVGARDEAEGQAVTARNWKVLYFAMMWTTVGIMIRCIYRIIEYSQGYDGYIPTHEVFFYTLDSLPLFLAISVWTVIWPPSYINHAKVEAEQQTSNGNTTPSLEAKP